MAHTLSIRYSGDRRRAAALAPFALKRHRVFKELTDLGLLDQNAQRIDLTAAEFGVTSTELFGADIRVVTTFGVDVITIHVPPRPEPPPPEEEHPPIAFHLKLDLDPCLIHPFLPPQEKYQTITPDTLAMLEIRPAGFAADGLPLPPVYRFAYDEPDSDTPPVYDWTNGRFSLPAYVLPEPTGYYWIFYTTKTNPNQQPERLNGRVTQYPARSRAQDMFDAADATQLGFIEDVIPYGLLHFDIAGHWQTPMPDGNYHKSYCGRPDDLMIRAYDAVHKSNRAIDYDRSEHVDPIEPERDEVWNIRLEGVTTHPEAAAEYDPCEGHWVQYTDGEDPCCANTDEWSEYQDICAADARLTETTWLSAPVTDIRRARLCPLCICLSLTRESDGAPLSQEPPEKRPYIKIYNSEQIWVYPQTAANEAQQIFEMEFVNGRWEFKVIHGACADPRGYWMRYVIEWHCWTQYREMCDPDEWWENGDLVPMGEYDDMIRACEYVFRLYECDGTEITQSSDELIAFTGFTADGEMHPSFRYGPEYDPEKGWRFSMPEELGCMDAMYIRVKRGDSLPYYTTYPDVCGVDRWSEGELIPPGDYEMVLCGHCPGCGTIIDPGICGLSPNQTVTFEFDNCEPEDRCPDWHESLDFSPSAHGTLSNPRASGDRYLIDLTMAESWCEQSRAGNPLPVYFCGLSYAACFVWSPENPERVEAGASEWFTVIGGKPPYEWYYSGPGYIEPDGGRAQLFAPAGVAGDGEFTVVDACGFVVDGGVELSALSCLDFDSGKTIEENGGTNEIDIAVDLYFLPDFPKNYGYDDFAFLFDTTYTSIPLCSSNANSFVNPRRSGDYAVITYIAPPDGCNGNCNSHSLYISICGQPFIKQLNSDLLTMVLDEDFVTADSDDSVTISWTGGVGPFTAAVSGTDYEFEFVSTEIRQNTLHMGCGTGEFTITDACGEVVYGTAFSNDGAWIHVSYQNAKYAYGIRTCCWCTTTESGETTGCWKLQSRFHGGQDCEVPYYYFSDCMARLGGYGENPCDKTTPEFYCASYCGCPGDDTEPCQNPGLFGRSWEQMLCRWGCASAGAHCPDNPTFGDCPARAGVA